jgi:hypothetical protein
MKSTMLMRLLISAATPADVVVALLRIHTRRPVRSVHRSTVPPDMAVAVSRLDKPLDTAVLRRSLPLDKALDKGLRRLASSFATSATAGRADESVAAGEDLHDGAAA